MIRDFFNFLFELAKVVIISLVIIIPIRYYVIQPFYVKGASMEPSFYDHEYLIIDEISYRFNNPERGDVVVFRYPRNPQEFFIKRVIGMPGEKVQIKDGVVYIFNEEYPNGFILDEPYLEPGTKTFGMSDDVVYVGKSDYYVLGDNRNASKDSRSFGAVNKSFFIGKVLLRGWPLDRVEFFQGHEY